MCLLGKLHTGVIVKYKNGLHKIELLKRINRFILIGLNGSEGVYFVIIGVGFVDKLASTCREFFQFHICLR